MILFPYKKVVIETEMSEDEFFSKLNDITDKSTLFDFGCSDNYFIGEILNKEFSLKIALKNYQPKDYESNHQTKIVGSYESNIIKLKFGYGLSNYLSTLLPFWFVFSSFEKFGLNLSTILLFIICFAVPYLELRDYKYYKQNCNEIEKKFLKLTEGKLCKK